MGDNTLVSVSNGDKAIAETVNQYTTALKGDLIPRDSSSIATNEGGNLGSESARWLKAFIESGCFSVGDIKPHHTFNGAAPIGQGWFPCNGDVINQVNYDAIFSEGDWDKYVIASLLDGKYSPNLVDKYLIGSNTTTETGDTEILPVGNSGNATDLSHTHQDSGHSHQWRIGAGYSGRLVNNTAVGDALTWNSGGSYINYNAGIDGHVQFTSTETESALSSTTDIQPESIRTIYLIRIV